ncbi:hypothetical protein V8B97DRAFT_2111664 [Scleroderma yunnanense]
MTNHGDVVLGMSMTARMPVASGPFTLSETMPTTTSGSRGHTRGYTVSASSRLRRRLKECHFAFGERWSCHMLLQAISLDTRVFRMVLGVVMQQEFKIEATGTGSRSVESRPKSRRWPVVPVVTNLPLAFQPTDVSNTDKCICRFFALPQFYEIEMPEARRSKRGNDVCWEDELLETPGWKCTFLVKMASKIKNVHIWHDVTVEKTKPADPWNFRLGYKLPYLFPLAHGSR